MRYVLLALWLLLIGVRFAVAADVPADATTLTLAADETRTVRFIGRGEFYAAGTIGTAFSGRYLDHDADGFTVELTGGKATGSGSLILAAGGKMYSIRITITPAVPVAPPKPEPVPIPILPLESAPPVAPPAAAPPTIPPAKKIVYPASKPTAKNVRTVSPFAPRPLSAYPTTTARASSGNRSPVSRTWPDTIAPVVAKPNTLNPDDPTAAGRIPTYAQGIAPNGGTMRAGASG